MLYIGIAIGAVAMSNHHKNRQKLSTNYDHRLNESVNRITSVTNPVHIENKQMHKEIMNRLNKTT
jgi:hypothetical protein